jgi:hypothetical protein
MKTIALNPLLSVLEIDSLVMVKNIEPLENCTVTIHDVPIEPKEGKRTDDSPIASRDDPATTTSH